LENKPVYETKQATVSAPLNDEVQRRKKTILVIEDSTEYRQFIADILGSTYHLKLAENETKALNMLRRIQPDLIICDIMLESIGGIELIKIIRKQKRLSTLPVVFLSARHTSSIIKKGLDAGANAYLTKPVSARVLAAQVKVLIKNTQNANWFKTDKQTKSNTFMRTIESLIERHIADKHLTLDQLASQMHISTSTLYRKWSQNSGRKISLKQYILRQKLTRAMEQAKEDNLTIEQAATLFGFSSAAYFSMAYKREFGKSPSEDLDER